MRQGLQAKFRLALSGACAAGAMMAAPAKAGCEFSILAKLPVTMDGMRASVPVKVKGEKADLWIDTGAFFNFMSRAKAAQLGLRLEPLPVGFYIKGIGGDAKVQLGRVDEIELAGMPLKKMEFVVGGSDAGNGFIGANMFYNFDSEFDMAHGQINLTSAKGCGKSNLAYWAGERYLAVSPIMPGEYENDRHIYTRVTINGVAMKAMLDTGATGTILMRKSAERAGIDLKAPSVVEDGEASGIGSKRRQEWVARLASFDIGGETIQNTPIRVLDEEGLPADIIIGMDFFLSHHLLVSRSQHQVYITYNGGPIFSLSTEKVTGKMQTREDKMGGAQKEEQPTDAAGFARRGLARLAQRDYAGAIADLSEAIRQKPDNGDYLRDRAQAYAGNHQFDLAHKDEAAAVNLLPNDPKLLAERAMNLVHNNPGEAQALAERALKLMPKGALAGMVLADVFEVLHQPQPALGLMDDMIALHRDDSKLGHMLNERCWLRGLANVDLDKATKDCESAIRRDGARPSYVASRALIAIRKKDYGAALADLDKYSAEKMPEMLRYLRGLARIGAGQKPAGEADLAEVAKSAPRVKALMEGYGLVP